MRVLHSDLQAWRGEGAGSSGQSADVVSDTDRTTQWDQSGEYSQATMRNRVLVSNIGTDMINLNNYYYHTGFSSDINNTRPSSVL